MNILKKARYQKHWTQQKLANKMNVNLQTVAYWENVHLPSYPVLRELSLLLDYKFPNTPLIAQTIGQRIQLIRYENHLSQIELGKLIKATPTTIFKWENNKAIPNKTHLKRLIHKFNLSSVEIKFQIEKTKTNN